MGARGAPANRFLIRRLARMQRPSVRAIRSVVVAGGCGRLKLLKVGMAMSRAVSGKGFE